MVLLPGLSKLTAQLSDLTIVLVLRAHGRIAFFASSCVAGLLLGDRGLELLGSLDVLEACGLELLLSLLELQLLVGKLLLQLRHPLAVLMSNRLLLEVALVGGPRTLLGLLEA